MPPSRGQLLSPRTSPRSREVELLRLRHEVVRVRHAGDGAAGDADVRARDRLDLRLRLRRVLDPRLVEGERALGDALVAVARRVDAGVPSVEQLEQVVLRLVGRARVADRRDGELRVPETPRKITRNRPIGRPSRAPSARFREILGIARTRADSKRS